MKSQFIKAEVDFLSQKRRNTITCQISTVLLDNHVKTLEMSLASIAVSSHPLGKHPK